MLNFFKNKTIPDLVQFYPELAMYRIIDEADNTPLIHIRFASGDEQNIHKNIRINASSIQSISLETLNLDGYSPAQDLAKSKSIKFNSVLKIVRFNGGEETHELGQHKVSVICQPSKSTKENQSKWLDFEDVKEEINDKLQKVFSEALSSYLNIEEVPKAKSSSNLTQSQSKHSLFSTLLNICLISVLTYTVIMVGYNWFKGSDQSPQIQNTALEQLSPEELNKQASISAEDEALQEFGLEPGISLDQ